VRDEADVGLVDAEAERVRRHHGLELARHEAVLRELALGGRELAVVEAERVLAVVLVGEVLVDALRLLDRRHVDRAGARRRLEQVAQRAVLVRRVHRAAHLEAEVGAREAGDRHERVAHAELPPHVVAHLGGGGGREREDRRSPRRLITEPSVM
jgi:hypothetical protein